jgi:hypothetical protein
MNSEVHSGELCLWVETLKAGRSVETSPGTRLELAKIRRAALGPYHWFQLPTISPNPDVRTSWKIDGLMRVLVGYTRSGRWEMATFIKPIWHWILWRPS